jgi:hypothetical protein
VLLKAELGIIKTQEEGKRRTFYITRLSSVRPNYPSRASVSFISRTATFSVSNVSPRLNEPLYESVVQPLLLLARGKRERPPPTVSDLRYPLQQGRPNVVLYILPSYYNELSHASEIKLSTIPFGRILTSHTLEYKVAHYSHTKDGPLL